MTPNAPSHVSSERSARVVYLPVAPPGASELGPIDAHCERAESLPTLGGVSLAALDCSTALLHRVLEERALAMGATALVGAVCSEHPERTRVDCEARAIKLSRAAGVTPGSAGPQVFVETDLPAASTEFRTQVRFVPSASAANLQTQVVAAQEVTDQLVAENYVGVLQVTVSEPTTRDEAVKCVAIAAKRFNATHYGSPLCSAEPHRGGWSCASQLFAPELDERAIVKFH